MFVFPLANFLCYRSVVHRLTTTLASYIQYSLWCISTGRVCSSIKNFITYRCSSAVGIMFIISMVSPSLNAEYVLASDSLPTAPHATSFVPLLPGCKKKNVTELLDWPLQLLKVLFIFQFVSSDEFLQEYFYYMGRY